MKAVAPELVITDLTMPEMNGLELVTSVRRHYPGVPVILMTAYGSEALSIELLGRSGNVPKSRLADKLPTRSRPRWPRLTAVMQKLIRCLDAHFTFTRQRSVPTDPLVI